MFAFPRTNNIVNKPKAIALIIIVAPRGYRKHALLLISTFLTYSFIISHGSIDVTFTGSTASLTPPLIPSFCSQLEQYIKVIFFLYLMGSLASLLTLKWRSEARSNSDLSDMLVDSVFLIIYVGGGAYVIFAPKLYSLTFEGGQSEELWGNVIHSFNKQCQAFTSVSTLPNFLHFISDYNGSGSDSSYSIQFYILSVIMSCASICSGLRAFALAVRPALKPLILNGANSVKKNV